MARAYLTLQPPTTSFPFPAGPGGRIRRHWAPPATPAPHPPVVTPAVPRRLLLPAAAGIWDFISGGAGAAAAASLAVRRGSKTAQSSSDWMLQRTQMILRNLYGASFVRLSCMVGLDSRPVMCKAYALFKDGGDPEKLVLDFSHGSDGEIFYSSLYAGLYYESQKNVDMAKFRIVAACKSPYGSRFYFLPSALYV
ncbi:hypothetical protein PR202_gb20395 [Eleusine coracana subsp. coracana]|uniref:Uncharacterized protein n=1 Tax=Eleusine coracana subsp. coracana TaxID=191504 RepID=A0AAV5F8E7_ELECO|nr:hypothetical protein PR202_gb20395 [Eleusine coracana subsp. coracana]